MFKRMLLVFAVLAAVPSFAARTPAATTGGGSGLNSIGALLSLPKGNFAIGADYEHRIQPMIGIGGYLHYYSKNDSSKAAEAQPGQMAFGFRATAHFETGAWDFSLSPGMGFVIYDGVGTAKDYTTFGPSLGLGATYAFTKTFALGFEQTHYYGWFSKEYGGNIGDNMAVRAKFTF